MSIPFYTPGRGFGTVPTTPRPGRAASGMPKLSAKSMKKKTAAKKKKATTPRRIGRR